MKVKELIKALKKENQQLEVGRFDFGQDSGDLGYLDFEDIIIFEKPGNSKDKWFDLRDYKKIKYKKLQQ